MQLMHWRRVRQTSPSPQKRRDQLVSYLIPVSCLGYLSIKHRLDLFVIYSIISIPLFKVKTEQRDVWRKSVMNRDEAGGKLWSLSEPLRCHLVLRSTHVPKDRNGFKLFSFYLNWIQHLQWQQIRLVLLTFDQLHSCTYYGFQLSRSFKTNKKQGSSTQNLEKNCFTKADVEVNLITYNSVTGSNLQQKQQVHWF